MGSVKFVISLADTMEVFYDSVCTSLWKFFYVILFFHLVNLAL